MKELEKKWGFPTALSMVIGIVIGSGIFFKGSKVLSFTGGNMPEALFVIGSVGIICIVCSNVFAEMGKYYAECNGLVDYAEVSLGKKFAYAVGWFTSSIYNPAISAITSYIAATYFCMMVGFDVYGKENLIIGLIFMVLIILMNVFTPKLAGKFQVSSTIIKLIPIVSMALIGTIIGIINGNGIEIFTNSTFVKSSNGTEGIFSGICAFAFAYEGWIAATTINAELKNPKRDLPLALIVGGIFCTVIYMLYVYSMSATLSPSEIIEAGDSLPKIAFTNIFGNVAGNLIMAFIVISCLGTSNGMTICTMRGFYSLALRGKGKLAKSFSQINEKTGMPLKSCVVGIVLMFFWLFQFSTLYLQGPLAFNGTHNPNWLLAWEADEACVITMYAIFIPIFIHIIRKETQMSFFHRFILPAFAIIMAVFMCYCSYVAYGIQIVYYLLFFILLEGIGVIFYINDKHH